jgi:hypothetical protein
MVDNGVAEGKLYMREIFHKDAAKVAVKVMQSHHILNGSAVDHLMPPSAINEGVCLFKREEIEAEVIVANELQRIVGKRIVIHHHSVLLQLVLLLLYGRSLDCPFSHNASVRKQVREDAFVAFSRYSIL